jgi:hypothetical protein
MLFYTKKGDIMSTVTLECGTCKKDFEKPKGEYNRRLRLGKTKFYCCLSCAKKTPESIKHIVDNRSGYPVWELNNPKRYDEYSMFRPFMKVVKQRNKEWNISLEYLKELWESQDGTCPFTGFKLEARTHYSYKSGISGNGNTPLNIKVASLDRIDNSKGYIVGNVRFVSVMFNYARNIFSDEEVVEFAKAIVNTRG